MANENTDVNLEAASSNASAVASEAANQDAQTVSSTEKTAANTSVGESLEDVLAKGFKESVAKEESQTAEGAEEKSGDQQLNATEKEGDKEVAEAGDKEDVTGEEETQGPIPYDRFQQVVQEKNEAKIELERLSPLAKAQEQVFDFCRQNNLTNEDFTQAMEFAALLKNNPQAFMEKFKPVLEGLGVVSGDKLPEDLQKDVDDNVMPLARAKELAQLRARQAYQGNLAQLTEKQKAERAQQEFVQSVQKSWTDWDTNKRKANPDFKPGGKSGMWELVNDRMTAMAQAIGSNGQPLHPIRSPQDAVALAEAAFKFVAEKLKVNGSKPPVRRSLSSSSSSQSTTKSPVEQPSFEAAMTAKARELGILQ